MADTKKTDTPEKNGQTVLSDDKTQKEQTSPDRPVKAPEQAPDKEAPPIPEDKAPTLEKDGKAVAPPTSERVINMKNPSGKAAPTPKETDGDKAEDSNKEQAALDTKKKAQEKTSANKADDGLSEKDAVLKKEQEK